MATSLSLLGDSALYIVLPTRAAELGLTIASIGVLLSINRFVRLVLNGPIGIAYTRWPRRRLFVPAVFLGAISTAMVALAPDFWIALLGRIFWGIAWVGIWIGGNTIVLEASSGALRGRSIGRYQISFYLGAAGGAILGGVLVDLMGFRTGMLTLATLGLIGAVLTLFFLPETQGLAKEPSPNLARGSIQSEPEPTPDQIRPQLASAIALLSAHRLTLAGVLVPTLSLLLLSILGDPISIADFQIPVATVAGLGLGLATLLSMIAAPISGQLSDRARSRWSIASAGLIPGIAGFALLAVASPIGILVGVPLAGLSGGSSQSLSTTITGDLGLAADQSRRLGWLFTAGDFASAIGPLFVFLLIPVIGLSPIYWMSAVILSLMFLVAGYWAFTIREVKTGNARSKR